MIFMKKFSVEISAIAENDLYNIVAYIVETYNDVNVAEKIYDNIIKKIYSLENSPEKNILVESQPEKNQGMRIQLANKYSILYWVEDELVMVFKIVSSSSKYIAHLRGYD